MTRLTLHATAAVSMLVFASFVPAAQAADEPFVVADASGVGKRFMPLAPTRNGLVVHNVSNRTPMRADTSLRSDRTAMEKGFLRIDRTNLRPVHSYRSAARAAEPVTIVRPQAKSQAMARTGDATITDLFAAAPETLSFREAMRHSGMTRQVGHAWPLPSTTEQRFTSGYGMRRDPFHGRQAFHGGIDIAAKAGTPILASADGVVQKVAATRGMGKFVTVAHRDGTQSTYGHLSAQNVRIGQRVMQGQQVGELGSTGRSTGPHLDYRIKKNGQSVNPMAYLRAPSSINTRLASR